MPLLATPPDFDLLRRAEDCTLAIGPYSEEGPRPVRAACSWPEAHLAPLRSALLDFADYPQLVPLIERSEVVRREGDRVLVHQVYRVPLLARREAMLWMSAHERPDGGVRVDWSVADSEPWTPEQGHVQVSENRGFWEVAPQPGGGVAVVHQIAYDPGVHLPDWLVARFRTNGLASVMSDLRKRAGGATGSP
jgi:Polyketide cyclase / dehydrase and lipid transport